MWIRGAIIEEMHSIRTGTRAGEVDDMGFRVGIEKRGSQTVHTLLDEATGASAAVLASHGFNLFDLRLPLAGAVRPVLFAAEDFAEHPRSGAGNGTPILFPYPNRVRDASFVFQGRTYKLPANNGKNAIHGFAVNAPWDVVEHRADAESAWITGRYQLSRHSPEHLEQWPADALLQVTYSLTGRRLTMSIEATNPTAMDLPYGFGIHPYFRFPFTPDADPEQSMVILPASRYWVLEGFLPTGEVRPVDRRLDFRRGQPMRGLKLDDVLTGLEPSGERHACRLVDLARKAEFRLGLDRNFRELVVYTPPSRPDVISLEPYTQATDAINLQARGIDSGLRVLGHGARDVLTLTMETIDG
jgi:aldose 1-epimerase